MKVYLVRHGEAEDDTENCYGGIADFPLTEHGIETARDLSEKLKGRSLSKIFSSPYKRASKTAAILSDTLDIDVECLEGLRERNSYGVMSGVNKERSKIIFERIFNDLKSKAGDYYSDELVVGAEPVDEFDLRVGSVFEEIIKKSSDLDSVCVVTHGNVTRSVYKNLLEIPNKIGLGLLAVTEMEYSNGSWSIISNDGVTLK